MEFIRGAVMNMEQRQAAEQLPLLLRLTRRAVGVKFAATKSDYDREPARELLRPMPYCVAVQCATRGHAIKLDRATSGCPGSSRALGLAEPDADYFSGKRGYQLGLYRDVPLAGDVASGFSILQQPAYGVIVKPLADWQTQPDCVLVIANAYAVMRIIQGYTYQFGMRPHFSMTGNQGVCIECTSYPYNHQVLNASFLCSGTRYHAGWAEEEAGVGMPFSIFTEVVEGIAHTANRTEPDGNKCVIAGLLEGHGFSSPLAAGEAYYL